MWMGYLVLTGALIISGDFVHGRRADSLFDIMSFDLFLSKLLLR
jgi:hypothetical protein